MEYPEFKDSLEEALRDSYPSDEETLTGVHGLPQSLPEDPREKKKVQDRLVRLGFRYSDLAKYFG